MLVMRLSKSMKNGLLPILNAGQRRKRDEEEGGTRRKERQGGRSDEASKKHSVTADHDALWLLYPFFSSFLIELSEDWKNGAFLLAMVTRNSRPRHHPSPRMISPFPTPRIVKPAQVYVKNVEDSELLITAVDSVM